MNHRTGGIFILLLALPMAARGEDPKDKPATPAQEYQALLKDYQKAQTDFFDALQKAPDEERAKVRAEKTPRFGPKFLALAEKYPKDPIALDALVWVANDFLGGSDGSDPSLKKAMELLLRDHVESEKLAGVCQHLGSRFSSGADTFLQAILEKSPHKAVQAEACLSLAQRPLFRAEMAEDLAKDPDSAKQLTESLGKDFTERLRNLDVDKERAESEKHFRRFADKYSGEMTPKRLAQLCQRLGFATDKVSESVLRNLAEKDSRTDVQGVATLCLTKVLGHRADALPETEAKEIAKLHEESEALLERAADKYADAPLAFSGTVGKQAKKDLYTLRNLTVGKVAPDIEGEDQDGKPIKLSEYRGKVVMLDFWSQH